MRLGAKVFVQLGAGYQQNANPQHELDTQTPPGDAVHCASTVHVADGDPQPPSGTHALRDDPCTQMQEEPPPQYTTSPQAEATAQSDAALQIPAEQIWPLEHWVGC